jgi:hypothetical protein
VNTPEFDVAPLSTGTACRSIHYYRRLTRAAPTVFEFGIATIAAGERLPATGTVALPADAFGFCIRGRLLGGPESAPQVVSGGTMCHVQPGISQFGQYLEDCILAYAYFGDLVSEPCVPNRHEVPSLSKVEYRKGAVSSVPRPGIVGRAFNAGPAILDVAVARLKKGDKLPKSCSVPTSVFQAEIILHGRLLAHLDSVRYELVAGDVLMLPPNTKQSAEVVEDTELVVMFFGDSVPTLNCETDG